MGNHEHKLRDCPKKYGTMYSAFTKAIGKFGVHIMENEEIKIGNTGIKVYGLDLEHMYYRRLIEKKVPEGYLEKKLGKADQKSYNSLIIGPSSRSLSHLCKMESRFSPFWTYPWRHCTYSRISGSSFPSA